MEHPILEPMGDFFDRRAADYEEHQIHGVDGGDRMYPFTASLLPDRPGAEILVGAYDVRYLHAGKALRGVDKPYLEPGSAPVCDIYKPDLDSSRLVRKSA